MYRDDPFAKLMLEEITADTDTISDEYEQKILKKRKFESKAFREKPVWMNYE